MVLWYRPGGRVVGDCTPDVVPTDRGPDREMQITEMTRVKG